MSLNTIITNNLAGVDRADKPLHALVLMGGGARTAYQVGVLQAIAELLSLQGPAGKGVWPFKLLVGTSAGALNCAYLASQAHQGLQAAHALAKFWQTLSSELVYELNVPWWMRANRLLTAFSLSRRASGLGAVLDNLRLIDTLHKNVALTAIDENLQQRHIDALVVTASSYNTGLHWSFCQSRHPTIQDASRRAGRRLQHEPITIDHLAASSAIPFVFPAAQLFVDGRREFFGDGSMRHVSPLSAPMKLGASHVLAIGVGQPERGAMTGASPGHVSHANHPTLGRIAGHAMASVFHDTLRADVEHAQRVNETLANLPREVRQGIGYRPVKVLSIAPSQSLDELALQHAAHLPAGVRNVLTSLGAHGGGNAALASYLLFEQPFVRALIELGRHDAMAQKEALLGFF